MDMREPRTRRPKTVPKTLAGGSLQGRQSESGLPLYLQVKRALEEQILSGQLRRGDLLPPEVELCSLFAVSTITVRRALMELARDGLIRRKGGIGTVVTAESKKTKFGLLFLGFDDDDWSRRAAIFGSLLGGIGDAAWRANADFSTIRIGASEDPLPVLKMLADERELDGILLRVAGDIDEAHVAFLESRGMPYVVIKRHLEGRSMSFVTRDDAGAAAQATEHLIGLGHRRIGLIVGPLDISPRRALLEGYRRTIERHGLPCDERLVKTMPSGRLPTEADGFESMRELLLLPSRPTAVVTNGAFVTGGAYDAISRAGLRISEDVAVVGCGETFNMPGLRPALTAVSTSYEEIGRVAAETLFRLIARPGSPPLSVFVTSALDVRESCGAGRALVRPADRMRDGVRRRSPTRRPDTDAADAAALA